MKIAFFSSEFGIVSEWKSKHHIENSESHYEIDSLEQELKDNQDLIVIIDYDSISNEFNKLMQAGKIPTKTIVLEKAPEIATGKMLLAKGVKAYGNSRMLTSHFQQMLDTVEKNKIWTYPELTASLAKNMRPKSLNKDAQELIQNRLSSKEIEVVYYILDGLTNDAIATKLEITTRTVKAHVSSVFSKLHVSDRISLVLLLK